MLGFDVGLLDGLFPLALTIATCAALLGAMVRKDRDWWIRTVAPAIVGSLLVVALINRLLDLRSRFGEIIPLQFVLFAALPLIAIVIGARGWRSSGRLRRFASVVAVPLAVGYAANSINQYYSYVPTVGALVGADLEHQVPPTALELSQLLPGPTPTPASTPASTPGSTPASTPASTPQVGHRHWKHGAVTRIDIPGTVSHFVARPSYVWVPPAFFEQPRPQLPVVVILAGTPGEPDNMIRAGHANAVAERYAAAHDGIAPILVFADGNGSFTADTECVDSNRGAAETYLTVDVPAFVTRVFSTATGPAHWAVEGFSEGGTCAAVLALGHPDVYGAFVDIAGDPYPNVGAHGDRATTIRSLYGGDEAAFTAHDPTVLIQRPSAQSVGAWFEAGHDDHRRVRTAREFDERCRNAGLQSHLTITSGGHDFSTARHGVADSFSWLAGRLGA